MWFHLRFSILIVSLILMSHTFTAHADVIDLSIEHTGSTCTNALDSVSNVASPANGAAVPVDNSLKCAIAVPYSGHFSLNCKPSRAPTNLSLVWYKDNIPLLENERIKIHGSNDRILNFTAVVPDDAGRYQCRAVKKGESGNVQPEKTLAIEIQVLPYVKNAHKEVTAIEESNLNLTCIVLSTVPTEVYWEVETKDAHKNYTQSEGRVVLSKINSTINALFHIKSANLTLDRGTYTCFAKSEVGVSPTNTKFVVRIKSKYAALWPFLGICAEVIILCTIILIYEKKRDKSEMEESDTDQGAETKSSPDHGQDGVRYRK